MKGVITAIIVAALIIAAAIIFFTPSHQVPKPKLDDSLVCAMEGGHLHYEEGLGWQCNT